MAIKSSLRNMALVLTLVCLGASAAVAVIYAVTKDPIAVAKADKTNKAIKQVVPTFDNNPSEEILNVPADLSKPNETNKVYVAKKGDEVVGYAVESTTGKGFGGAFTIMVGFTPNGEVYNTSVISHSETPGLGAKITDGQSHFITQWNGKNLVDGSVKIAVTKDGGDIDAITASTITSRAYCDAMEIAANVFNNINNQ
ncbi:MAG: RnfABCDGE type electron transport complex subunit G [Bacteroidales bacterium]|nr:RnfABCDGE type electron transport complex subunit G [Bacteroidales bacterium]MBR4980578.1 RnfABCDGE type electron transport complex subunit G [Bacteroidales bacterium]MBR5907697.1 RnfABCDGE type electron transport complex subunit G [Bacteroidales bacterium]